MSRMLAPLLAAIVLGALTPAAYAQPSRFAYGKHGEHTRRSQDDRPYQPHLRHRSPSPRRRHPNLPSRPPQVTFRFDGQFESLPISFVASSPDGIFQACQAESAAFRSEWVDDIQVVGQRHRNGSGYWSVDALCAIAALNARPVQARFAVAPVTGKVESVPFRIVADRRAAESLLHRYMPVALQNEWVDEISVEGQTHRNPSGWWNMDQIIQIVLSHVTGVYAVNGR